ncbi:hypothetical protein [uncultured Methylobacterium sp.]|uniref:hypothetical protein n=1 Tax=uncultured Methylobacterium sp. TaxID=157278 RepID=UPI0035CB4DBB
MVEAVRRFRETGGSDIVRRLIARPIRLDPPRTAVRAEPTPAAPEVLVPDAAFEAAPSASACDDLADGASRDEPEDGDIIGRLQAEMALMKAVLMAERAESAALRARIGQEPEPEALGPEAGATRARRAGMADRVLSAR